MRYMENLYHLRQMHTLYKHNRMLLNKCTYCDMYRDKTSSSSSFTKTWKTFRNTHMVLKLKKIFVADGDALCMPMDHWLPMNFATQNFPRLRRVSCYAMARNINKNRKDCRFFGKMDSHNYTLVQNLEMI